MVAGGNVVGAEGGTPSLHLRSAYNLPTVTWMVAAPAAAALTVAAVTILMLRESMTSLPRA